MHAGKLVFAQVMEHLPLSTFHGCVARYGGHHKVQRFSCLDQFLCMAFAQLTYRESLREIEACLRAQSSKLYHLGFRATIARNTLANANATRDWRIYCEFAHSLIRIARRPYANDLFRRSPQHGLYARCHDDRSVSVGPPVGPFSHDQSRDKRAVFQEHGVPENWIVVPDSRLVERCRPGDMEPEALVVRLVSPDS